MLLAAVGMAAVHHDGRTQVRCFQIPAGRLHAGFVIVGRLAAAQNDVAILVARCVHDGHLTVLVYRQEVVPARGRLDGIGGDLEIAVRAVLEADRGRQPAGQLTVHLAFCGAGTDGAPADEVADVLGRNHVQEFARSRKTQPVDLDEQLAGDAQPLVDAAALIEVGVVDEALPAHGGAGLLEVHPHHHFQSVAVGFAQLLQAAGIVERGGHVMDGARADDHQQAVILAPHDVVNGAAGVLHQLLHRRAMNGEETDQVVGRRQHGQALEAGVVGLAGLVGRLGKPGCVVRLAGGHEGNSLHKAVGRTGDETGKKKPPEIRRF